jgi:hypothetical protein
VIQIKANDFEHFGAKELEPFVETGSHAEQMHVAALSPSSEQSR